MSCIWKANTSFKKVLVWKRVVVSWVVRHQQQQCLQMETQPFVFVSGQSKNCNFIYWLYYFYFIILFCLSLQNRTVTLIFPNRRFARQGLLKPLWYFGADLYFYPASTKGCFPFCAAWCTDLGLWCSLIIICPSSQRCQDGLKKRTSVFFKRCFLHAANLEVSFFFSFSLSAQDQSLIKCLLYRNCIQRPLPTPVALCFHALFYFWQ